MAYEVFRAASCTEDLDALFEFLRHSYEDVGEPPVTAVVRAADRLREVEDELEHLGSVPHQGTLWPEVMPGLRWVTKRRAIFYFIVDDNSKRINVLAIFFGGQNHRQTVLDRLFGQS